MEKIENGAVTVGETQLFNLDVIGNQDLPIIDFRFWYGENEYETYEKINFRDVKWFRMRLTYQDGKYHASYFNQ